MRGPPGSRPIRSDRPPRHTGRSQERVSLGTRRESTVMLLAKVLVIAHFAILALLSVYGVHRFYMLFLYYFHKKNQRKPLKPFDELPTLTVQLPTFNEVYVIERLIDAVAKMEYPRDRFQIQVLDDSTDDTTEVAARKVEEWSRRGLDIELIHRVDRSGFKAGALENGLKTAKGEYVAIFDADFVPTPNCLLDNIHYFTDPKIAMIQFRWVHINEGYSLLTRVQSILLDGHFVIEHTARNRSGRFFNFNGTAGVWRRTAIADAGGWQHDTLTEDLDLSYRAQLRGWQFVFLPHVAAPSEVPVEMNAFKAQQKRWAMGSIQTALKLLPSIWKSKMSLKVKGEATFHLTNNFAYLFLLLMSLLLLPATLSRAQFGWHNAFYIDLFLFVSATVSVAIFYLAAQREADPESSWWTRIKYLPMIMSVGIGLTINNSRAVLEAIFGADTPFERTAKYGVQGKKDVWQEKKYRRRRDVLTYLEFVMGCYFMLVIYSAWEYQLYSSIPILSLFPLGFFYMSLWSLFQGRRRAQPQAVQTEVTVAARM